MHARIPKDPIPNVSTAGFIPKGGAETAALCIQPDSTFNSTGRSSTPEHIRKYRKSTNGEPGVRVVHPGMRDDVENIDRNRAFGKIVSASDPVSTVIKANNLNGLADKFNDIKESKYASQLREPLGKSYSRAYNMPEETASNGFAFGVASGKQMSAKELIYPSGGSQEERPETAAMYAKTHGNIPAGAQKNRNYNWPVDVSTHVFGYGEKRLINGAGSCIHAERVDNLFPKTVIVAKTVEDVKATNNDILGKSKNLG